MRVEIQTVDSDTDFLAVLRLSPDHIRFVAPAGMDASRTFAAAVEALTVAERDRMRAALGIGTTVQEAPSMEAAYPVHPGMTIDEVGAYLGCLVDA